MYMSDYGYASDLVSCQKNLVNYSESACINTNWIHNSKNQWTIIPDYAFSNRVMNISSTGALSSGYTHGEPILVVRPALYLKSDVGIVEEKETSTGIKYYVVE
jgi:hypothetical protein